MKAPSTILAACAVVLSALTPALAQEPEDYRARQENLAKLATIFGEMHHIRRMCEPRREADAWRNRMKKLVELEDPAASQRDVLVRAFNDGYSRAQKRYDICSRSAEDYAASRASEGERIVKALTDPLYESVEGDDAFPTVWRGGQR